MKSLLITLIVSVTGYQPDVAQLQSILAPIAPVQIEVINLAEPQPSQTILHYQLVRLHVRPSIKIYLHSYYIGGLSGGRCYPEKQIGNVAIVPGYDERNFAVLLHELGHKFGLGHTEECSVMSPQPCGLEFLERDVLRAKRFIRKKR